MLLPLADAEAAYCGIADCTTAAGAAAAAQQGDWCYVLVITECVAHLGRLPDSAQQQQQSKVNWRGPADAVSSEKGTPGGAC